MYKQYHHSFEPHQVKSQLEPPQAVHKRRVIAFRPLAESPMELAFKASGHRSLADINTDSSDSLNASDNSSSLSFSPTSVLPVSGTRPAAEVNKQKLLPSQLHIALTADTSLTQGLRQSTFAANATHDRQPGPASWTQRHFVHDLSSLAPLKPATFLQAPGMTSAEKNIPLKPKVVTTKQAQHADQAQRGTLEAAWRWQFRRQWRKAQAQAFVPESEFDSDDPWHLGLQMIQAANASPGSGVPMPDHHCYCDGPAASPLLDTDDDQEGLFEFEHDVDTSAFATDIRPRPALAEASRRAQELVTHQAILVRAHTSNRPSQASADRVRSVKSPASQAFDPVGVATQACLNTTQPLHRSTMFHG